ncbi:SPFH domain-containing protein [Amycolatopsis methanolica]|uniref:SPFH domain-containing protein n=1 Tax=Amycolatopsis methanolica TaxID=1814 RepID=UPI0034314E32
MFDALRGELVDIIEWLDGSRDTIVWRFPRYENEIKMGAQLIVRESQIAVFVNEGRIADTYLPGRYELHTQNMPILTSLLGWKYGFDSPFKAEVYFVNTRLFTDLKWGTQNPLMMRDPEFGNVRVRAFGAFALQVVEPRALLVQLAGTDPDFRTDEVEEYLRQLIVSRVSTALSTAGVPVLDLAAHQGDIGASLAVSLSQELAPMGLRIPQFVFENISLPPEVEKALDRRTQQTIAGDLDDYTRFQAAQAIGDAAHNPGSGAGEGLGLGLGMMLGQRAAAGLNAPAPATQAPPPLPQAQWFVGVDGEQRGPFDQAGLSQQAAAGALTGQTLVWRAGMPQWLPAAQVPELAPLLGATPPPLPPQA